MDIRNVATRHLHISCIRFFWKMQSWRQRTMTWCLLNRRSRHSRTNRKKWHFSRNRSLPLSNFVDRGFSQNPALARWTKSRQKPGKMDHFCLSDSPKSGCADLKVEQNLEKLRKCSTAAYKFGPRCPKSRTKSPKFGKMFYRRLQIRPALPWE